MTKVLVCDAEGEYWREVLPLLAADGCRVEMTGTAEAACRLLEKEPADVILLARLLPDTSGVELLELLKRSPQLKSIPVVMIAHAQDVRTMSECMALGARDYLIKPVESDLLRAAVRSALRVAPPPPLETEGASPVRNPPLAIPQQTLERLEEIRQMCEVLAPRVTSLRPALEVALVRGELDQRLRDIAIALAQLDLALVRFASLPPSGPPWRDVTRITTP